MASTHVRLRLDSLTLTFFDRTLHFIASIQPLARGMRSETYFFAFIALQLLEFSLFASRGLLDLPLAACLSASLVAGALMLGWHRLPPQTKPEELVVASLQVANQITTRHATVDVDAQSQTWADLMARISHEIRTPLNAVIGFSDLMECEIFGPLGNPRYRDYAAHIKASGDSLLRSAEDTLALSSLLATQPNSCSVQSTSILSLARDAWFNVEPQATRCGVTLQVLVPDRLEVAGNRRALRQALLNLMQEAVERAAPDSAIVLRAEERGESVQIYVGAAHPAASHNYQQPSTAICVARMLLELQGTSLQVSQDGQRWQAMTLLDLTVQPDFFKRA